MARNSAYLKEWAERNKEKLKKYYRDRQKRRTAHEPTRLAYNKHRREVYAKRISDPAYKAMKIRHSSGYRKRHPEKAKKVSLKSALKNTYGLEWETYTGMLMAQNNLCAICHCPPKRPRLDVDHCHTSGKVRELLCNVCNMKLAVLEDLEWRLKAEAYLEKHNGKTYQT